MKNSPDDTTDVTTSGRNIFNRRALQQDQFPWIWALPKDSHGCLSVDHKAVGMEMDLAGNSLGSASTVGTQGIWHETAGIELEADLNNAKAAAHLWVHKGIMGSSMSMGQFCRRRLRQGNLRQQ